MYNCYSNMNINLYYPTLLFKANKINLNNRNNDLVNIRRNDFIDYPIFYKPDEYTQKQIIEFSNKNKYKNYDINLLTTDDWDYAPYKVATMAKYLEENGRNSLIENSYPKIFQGINKQKLISNLDTLSYIMRSEQPKDEFNFDIDNKKLTAKYLGKGCNSIVYQLKDDKNNVVAMKSYLKPDQVDNYSIWGELAVYIATKDKHINNIPELYLSNPIATKVEDSTFEPTELYDVDNIKDYDGQKGAWTIIECITAETPKKPYGISLAEWLNKNNLHHLDASPDNVIGNYVTDLGGISN